MLANRRRLAVAKVSEHAGPGAHVLDAGCGAGPVALDLLHHGFAVHGVDIAQGILGVAPRLRSELERLRLREPLDGPRVGLHRYSSARFARSCARDQDRSSSRTSL
jgi:hypothetical protein